MSLTHKQQLVITAVVVAVCGLGIVFLLVPSVVPQAACQIYTVCYSTPTQNYYNGILQFYQHNPQGSKWALEQNTNQPPFNSGSHLVQIGGGWCTNEGSNLNNIRNEIATPHFAQNRPSLGLGGMGPYNQDVWRQAGFMDTPRDWKNIEISGLFYTSANCVKAGYGPESVDFVLRGGVNQGNGADPMACQATNYHVAYSGFVATQNPPDHGAKIERDIDHTDGYCQGCLQGNQIPGANIPFIGLGHVFGLKTVIYNNVANTAVRIDSYIDVTGSGNKWQLMYSVIDDGHLPAIDSVRGPIHCQGERPELPIVWGGPVVNYRINAAGVDVRQLTVQEIQAPRW